MSAPRNAELPIDKLLPEILEILRRGNRLVLQAAPGSGKTTRLPPALLRASFDGVLVLEPRRLAAKWAAVRVAEELGEEPGGSVGYRFRFENVGGPRTRLRFVTEGMFSRILLDNPQLEGISVVVLDEFHERHLHSDFALAYLRRLQERARPDLRLIVMSATLDTDALTTYLACPLLRLETRQFPVDVEFLPTAPAKPLEWTVEQAVLRALSDESSGDLLVFLPGMAEIRRSAERLSRIGERFRGVQVLPLHGDLPRTEQDRAMRKGPFRRVILSTNIAETSLTIEGVNTVIDSGLHRIASNSWWSGINALRTRPISRAAATQRAGRAGRTGPGRCIRLYTRGDHDARAPFEVPEILRLDLAQPVLELLSLGVGDLRLFPWFDAPPTQALGAACELLFRLGILKSSDASADLTSIGEMLARVPAHPRLARMLLEARTRGVLSQAADLAALIAEGELEGLDALGAFAGRVNSGEKLRRVREQLHGSVSRLRTTEASDKGTNSLEESLARSLLAGFPDRVAKKRLISADSSRAGSSQVELLFSAGGSALIEDSSIVSHDDFFVVVDAQERQAQQQARSRTVVRSLCPVRSEWLFDLEPGCVQELDYCEWDAQKQRVIAVSRLSYNQLVLLESSKPAEPGPAAQSVLLAHGLGLESSRRESAGISEWISALEKVITREELESHFGKLSLFARHGSETALRDPLNPRENVYRNLEPIFRGKSALADLKAMNWLAELAVAFGLPPEALYELDQFVPAELSLPSGRRAKIQYSLQQAPFIEARLQEFFGWQQSPALFRGKVPIVLHLLAPNFRPVQVTTDLSGFWSRTYPELRGQLSRRYPKHAWPDDPTKAPAKVFKDRDSGR